MTANAARHAAAGLGPVLSLRGVVIAEWLKLWSLRSTKWAALVAVPVMTVSAVLTASMSGIDGMDGPPGTADITVESIRSMSLIATTSGLSAAMLFVGVVAVIAGATEFSSGLAQLSFATVPRRHLVVVAKVVSAAGFGVLVGFVGVGVGALCSTLVFDARGYPVAVLDPAVVAPAAAGALTVGLLAIVASAVGMIGHSTAIGVAFLLAVLVALPLLCEIGAQAMQDPFLANAGSFLPAGAATTAVYTHPGFAIPPGMVRSLNAWLPESWQGAAIMVAWAVLAVAAALIAVRRRDI
jgi:ABC-2 type transport system permease protein